MTAAEQADLHLVDDHQDIADPVELWNARARAHNARAELLAAQRMAEELAERRHQAYLAEVTRRVERLQADQTLEVASWRHGAPPGTDTAPFGPPAPPDTDGVSNPSTPAGGDLGARAAALFTELPDAGRNTVMDRLGVSEHVAKNLIRDHKPAARA